MPSIIEFKTGRILASVNIPLHDIPLRDVLTERMGVPVYVENDAGCAALAEAFDGRADHRRLAGDAHDRDRRRRRLGAERAPVPRRDDVGGRGRAHDHRPRPRVRQPRARRPVPAARVAGAAGVGPRAGSARRLRGDAVSATRSWASSSCARAAIDGHDVVAGAESGDDASLWCLRVLGERIGIGIANAINTFDPLEVVIGGGVSRAGELLLGPARDAAFRHVVPGLGTEHDDPDRASRPARRGAGGGADRGAGVRRRRARSRARHREAAR